MQCLRQVFEGPIVIQIDPLPQRSGCHGAVKQAAVKVGKIEVRGEASGQCALPRRRRTVDCDNHAMSAPRSLNRVTKVGNEVRIQFRSSTRMPFSATMPRIRVDMARR